MSSAKYFASGTAYSYQATGPENNAGTWKVAPATSAHYRTRIVVHMPTNPSRFNGTVVVEWLNVSGGGDGAVDSVYLSPELERAGFAWVGVSAQQVGIDNLRQKDPARYGSLMDPGDQYSYDIYTQAARALLVGGHANPLAPLHPKRLLAVGESQSALYLTTYIDAIQPLYHVFDGFLVHSRAGGAVGIPGASPSGSFGGDVHIRTDIGVPVLMMITETDETFGGYYQARQPDTRFIRLWDVAGASHADSYIVTAQELKSLGCTSVDEAPSHFIFEAALSAINTWMVTGSPPPSAPRMEVQVVDGTPTVQTNTSGTAIGGIQGPWERVPIAAYSNTTPAGSAGFCVTVRVDSSLQRSAAQIPVWDQVVLPEGIHDGDGRGHQGGIHPSGRQGSRARLRQTGPVLTAGRWLIASPLRDFPGSPYAVDTAPVRHREHRDGGQGHFSTRGCSGLSQNVRVGRPDDVQRSGGHLRQGAAFVSCGALRRALSEAAVTARDR